MSWYETIPPTGAIGIVANNDVTHAALDYFGARHTTIHYREGIKSYVSCGPPIVDLRHKNVDGIEEFTRGMLRKNARVIYLLDLHRQIELEQRVPDAVIMLLIEEDGYLALVE